MANSNEYMNEYMKKRYRQRRQLMFDTLGNKCEKCGETDQSLLQIDHVMPKYMSGAVNISKMWNMKLSLLMNELELCQLLCAPCHLEKTRRDNSAPKI